MIGRLTGVIADAQLDGTALVDVAGVGYEVHLPLGTLGRVQAGGGETVTLHVHTLAREDALILYGFASADDKAAFRALLGVSKVGPKLALSILGSFDAQQLAAAIAAGDKAAFKGISGVGGKTAERLLLDLKDKLLFASGGTAVPVSTTRQPAVPASRFTGPAALVVGALVQMGYKRAAAERAVESVVSDDETLGTEALLRAALGAMS